ncbi:MAG: hypothetical protein LAP61_05670 [Acidobacteriia bacterium]|nr:hypothetical protein [Terriglobia bacterium]
MPDKLDASGLTVKTAAEITSDLTTGLKGVYGEDINVDQNSPDGQVVGILTQENVDLRELIANVNAGFDPDQAQGVVLDQRVAINGIQRQGGTYTNQPIDITVNATVNLQGLDADFDNPNGTGYTVQDGAGNQFILTDSVTLTAGTTTKNFRAKKIGAVNVPINTITNPVTIIPGVVSVINSSAAITVGQDQETDSQLRTRRAQSVSKAASGYLNGLLGVVLELPGVTEAALYENDGDTVDSNGIPAHGIWLIVSGGANSDIANAIYNKKSYGANMNGAVSVSILTASGLEFTAKFDRPTATNLYIRFNLKRTIPGTVFDTAAIAKYIATNLVYGIGAFAETSLVTDLAQAGIASQGGGGVPLDVQISPDGASWTDFLAAPTLNSEWTLDPARISITVV